MSSDKWAPQYLCHYSEETIISVCLFMSKPNDTAQLKSESGLLYGPTCMLCVYESVFTS